MNKKRFYVVVSFVGFNLLFIPMISGDVVVNYPDDNGVDISLQPVCNVTVNNSFGSAMNVTFASNYTGSWVNYQTNTSVANNSYCSWIFNGAVSSSSKYWWRTYAQTTGELSFTNNTFATTVNGSSVNEITCVDIDGDGDGDIVFGLYLISSVYWYENDGSNSFTEHCIDNGGCPWCSGVDCVDLDNDGDIDVVASGNDLYWYENDGSESFTGHYISTNGGSKVVTDDLDDDGDVDIILNKYFFENNGAEVFSAQVVSSNNWRSAAVGDFDGDGDKDIVAAAYNDDKVYWYKNDGNESFTEITLDSDMENVQDISVVDMEPDGDIDVVAVGDHSTSGTSWYENDGSAAWTEHVIADGVGWNKDDVITVDIDGDGDIDIINSHGTDNNLTYWINDGSESFTYHTFDSFDDEDYFSMGAMDFDNDGDIDVVSHFKTDSDTYSNITLFENDGTGVSISETFSFTTELGAGDPGALTVNAYDESTGENITNFFIRIVDQSGDINFTANQNNPVVFDSASLPNNANITITVGKSGYYSNSFTLDIYNGYFYINGTYYLSVNISAFLSNKSSMYLLNVVGPSDEYYENPPLENVRVLVKGLINNESYQTIADVYTDGNGQVVTYLIPGNHYLVTLSKSGYKTKVENFIPSSTTFTYTFRLYPEEPDVPVNDYFWSNIDFTGTMLSNSTIRVSYADSNSSTIDVTIRTFDNYEGGMSQVDIHNSSSDSFVYHVLGINKTRQYVIVMWFNNSADFVDQNSPVSIIVNPISFYNTNTEFNFNNRVVDLIGPATIGDWVIIASIILPLIILISFSPFNVGVAIIGSGFGLGFMQTIFGLWFTDGFNTGLALLAPVIIILGFMYFMTKGSGVDHL